MPEALEHTHFEGHTGETFRLEGGGNAAALVLHEVELGDFGVKLEGLRKPFTLIFRGPREPVLPEGMYALAHEAFEGVTIYVSPIVTFGDHQDYQSVFA